MHSEYSSDNDWKNNIKKNEEFNREDICKNCEAGIRIENCKKCIFQALTYTRKSSYNRVEMC